MAMDGFIQAKEITKKYAKTFYFASCFLDNDKKNAAYAVYAICRLSDEAVDNMSVPLKRDLNRLKEKIDSAYSQLPLGESILSAFRQTVLQYKIPKRYFDELIQGMEMDLQKSRYANFEELYDYCYKVAGVVGLIMLKIFEYENPEAERYAVNLGVAMQLTNILRDIKEDFARGRIYLPEEEMTKYGLTDSMISQDKIDDNFRGFMRSQIQRARYFYRICTKGIKMIKDLRTRFVVLLMKDIYSSILDEIEKNRYDIYSRRAQVNTLKKSAIALKILAKGKYL